MNKRKGFEFEEIEEESYDSDQDAEGLVMSPSKKAKQVSKKAEVPPEYAKFTEDSLSAPTDKNVCMYFMGGKAQEHTKMSLFSSMLSSDAKMRGMGEVDTVDAMAVDMVVGGRVPDSMLRAIHTSSLTDDPEMLERVKEMHEKAQMLTDMITSASEDTADIEEIRRRLSDMRRKPTLPNGKDDGLDEAAMVAPLHTLIHERARDLFRGDEERSMAEAAEKLQKNMSSGLKAAFGDRQVNNVHKVMAVLSNMNRSSSVLLRQLGHLPDAETSTYNLSSAAVRQYTTCLRSMLSSLQSLGSIDSVFEPHVNEEMTHIKVSARFPKMPVITMRHMLLMCRPVPHHPNRKVCANYMHCMSRCIKLGTSSSLEVRQSDRPKNLPGGYMTPEQVERNEMPAKDTPCIICILHAVQTACFDWSKQAKTPPCVLNPFCVEAGDEPDKFDRRTLLAEFDDVDGGKMARRTGIYGAFPSVSELHFYMEKAKSPRGVQYSSWTFIPRPSFRLACRDSN